ncbi:MAG: hypothetical protein K0S08_770 [Gammaproteobacteria bacterium]|jgi:hypothetical protein|nr:hypothetical protein [Gammaproteobacteria bacterium]
MDGVFNKQKLITLLKEITLTKKGTQSTAQESLAAKVNIFEIALIQALQASFDKTIWSLDEFLSFCLAFHCLHDLLYGLREGKIKELAVLTDLSAHCEFAVTLEMPEENKLSSLWAKAPYLYIRYSNQLYLAINKTKEKSLTLIDTCAENLPVFDQHMKVHGMTPNEPRSLSSNELQQVINIVYSTASKRQLKLSDVECIIEKINEYYKVLLNYYQAKAKENNVDNYLGPTQWLHLFETFRQGIDKYLAPGLRGGNAPLLTERLALLIRCLSSGLNLTDDEFLNIKQSKDVILLTQNYINEVPETLEFEEVMADAQKNGLSKDGFLKKCFEQKLGCYIKVAYSDTSTKYDPPTYRFENSEACGNTSYLKRYRELERLTQKDIEKIRGARGKSQLGKYKLCFDLEVTDLESKLYIKRSLSRKAKTEITKEDLVFIKNEVDELLKKNPPVQSDICKEGTEVDQEVIMIAIEEKAKRDKNKKTGEKVTEGAQKGGEKTGARIAQSAKEKWEIPLKLALGICKKNPNKFTRAQLAKKTFEMMKEKKEEAFNAWLKKYGECTARSLSERIKKDPTFLEYLINNGER